MVVELGDLDLNFVWSFENIVMNFLVFILWSRGVRVKWD